MAMTTTSTFGDSVAALYKKDYLVAATGMEYFDQLSWQREAMAANGSGSSQIFPIYEAMDVATTTLTEASDVTPVAATDSAVTITVAEYGNAVQLTSLLKATAYTDVGKAAAELVGINRARSLDIVVRDVAMAGSNVLRVKNVTARTSLTESNHLLDFGTLVAAVSRARSWNVPTGPDGYYTGVVNPMVSAELMMIPQWQSVSEYQDKTNIYAGEIGELAGIRFIESYNGKLFYGGGDVPATGSNNATITAAAAAGDTSITLSANLGVSVGDFLVIGNAASALETAVSEQVQVTALNGLVATVSGIGNAQGNFGLRYAHVNGAKVSESTQVGAIALQGPKSIGKVYSSITGPKGDLRITGPYDVLGRFVSFGWYHLGGWAITSQHWLLRLEFATSLKTIGANSF